MMLHIVCEIKNKILVTNTLNKNDQKNLYNSIKL